MEYIWVYLCALNLSKAWKELLLRTSLKNNKIALVGYWLIVTEKKKEREKNETEEKTLLQFKTFHLMHMNM